MSQAVANIKICHKCLKVVIPGCACATDMVSLNHHAEAGYCPLSKFPGGVDKPNGWDQLPRKSTGLPFDPTTPPAEIVPHLSADLPGEAWTKWENVREAYRMSVRSTVKQLKTCPNLENWLEMKRVKA